jgi:hypothetical protein
MGSEDTWCFIETAQWNMRVSLNLLLNCSYPAAVNTVTHLKVRHHNRPKVKLLTNSRYIPLHTLKPWDTISINMFQNVITGFFCFKLWHRCDISGTHGGEYENDSWDVVTVFYSNIFVCCETFIWYILHKWHEERMCLYLSPDIPLKCRVTVHSYRIRTTHLNFITVKKIFGTVNLLKLHGTCCIKWELLSSTFIIISNSWTRWNFSL